MRIPFSIACVFLILYAACSPSLAQTPAWKWVRDDLVLNPSGLDLSYAASWAWGDLNRDGYEDVIVRERRDPGASKLVAYRGRGPVAPPYWMAAPELLQDLQEPALSDDVCLADLDGDGALNLITIVCAGT